MLNFKAFKLIKNLKAKPETSDALILRSKVEIRAQEHGML